VPLVGKISRRLGLQGKLIVCFMMLLIAALGGSHYMFMNESRRMLLHSMTQRATSLAQTLAMASRIPIDTGDVRELARMAREFVKNDDIVNVAFSVFDHYFWDGRATSLAEQAKGPMANPIEMASTHEAVVAMLSAIEGYRRAFRRVYGDGRVDIDLVTDAIAAYETTRLSGGSAYDRFNAGDAAALSEDAREGLQIFFGRGRCNGCHLGPTFTDARFHNVGVGYDPRPGPPASGFADPGRYAMTHEPADIGAFKTPTLRDLGRRAPYMHDGSVATLADAVMSYVRIRANPWLDPLMEEVEIGPFDVPPLVAFLGSLDGTGYEDAAPRSFPE